MRNIYILIVVFVGCLEFNFQSAYSQMPAFQVCVKNLEFVPGPNGQDSLFTFDIYIADVTAGAHDPFNYAAAQFHLNYNSGIGTGLVLRKTGSDLPAGNQCPTFSATTSGRLSCSPNIPVNNNVIVPNTLPGIKALSLELRTSLHQFNQVPINLVWRTASPAPFTKVSYFDPNGMVVEIPVSANNQYCIDQVNPGPYPPTPYFYSSDTAILAGSSINFFDQSTRNPTGWIWSFPGGTPSTSALQNPTGITYNTPGTYSVTLTASNPFGSDSLTKVNFITVLPACPIIWENFIKFTDAAGATDTIRYGTSMCATNGIDTSFGELPLPPIPPSGVFDLRFLLLPTNDASKRDFKRDSVDLTIWSIKFQESAQGPMTISWNSAALPNTGFFFLKDIVNGTIVNVNMKMQSSYVLPTNLVLLHALNIEYKFFSSMDVCVHSNWNMLSVPFAAAEMRPGILFPGAVSPAYWFNGSGYITSDTLLNSRGYWIKFNGDTCYKIQGLKVSTAQIPVSSGWNMVGPFDENMVVSQILSTPPGIIISPFYGYENGYVTEDTLKPGKGYWVRTNASGVLFKSGADNLISETSGNDYKEFTRIEIAGNDGASSLYLAQPNQLSENFDLPPVPPAGIFDVRFATDKFVETYGHNNTIKINSASGELRLKITKLKENKLRLKDGLTGSLLNIELQENSEVVIPANLNNLVLIDESLIPDTYSLSQNFPNPFNPVTTISYQLPKEGHVKIVLYDVLGKEVHTLISDNLPAGQYKIKFNASNVSSGVYFYKMTAGDYSDIKRMVVIK